MRRKIPPLTTLRPFEAAARLGSFTAAADELSITQGAVSLQVRNLETFLGKQLFLRKTRRVELTEEGRQFAVACQRALDELERVTRSLVAQREHSILTVSALPTLATADSNLKCNTCNQVRFADVITSFVLVLSTTSA